MTAPFGKELTEIPFNIWDDYDEDKGETYGYIEEYDLLTEEDREAVASIVLEYVVKLPGIEAESGGEDVNFKNISYERLKKLVKELEKSELKYNGLPIYFYSES